MRARLAGQTVKVIEWIAGGFVLAMMLNTVVAIILRKFFAAAIPDYYDLGRFMLCIVVLWGIATTSYRGGHITMDVIWSVVGRRGKRLIDLFAELVTFAALVVLCLSVLDQVVQIRHDNILTYDIRMPTWPFLAVAWAGTVAALVLIAIRTYRAFFHRGGGLDADARLSDPA